MRATDLLKICDLSKDLRLLCVGDLMLDRFVYGYVDRISPEAPIPVLRQNSALTMLGAAGNVARNVASLGAAVVLSGAIGNDDEGQALLKRITEEERIEGEIACLSTRKTTLKTRYIANGQQLLRVDAEDAHTLNDDEEAMVCERIRSVAEKCDAILLSDYAKGCVTPAIIRACVNLATDLCVPLIVDPKGTNFSKYGKVSLIKPNANELGVVAGLPTRTDAEIEIALEKVMSEIEADALLVTRSEKGLSYKLRGESVVHVPTTGREVFDVSGAGDTSLAALGIALASGAGLSIASEFALSAAGIAVGKIGTAAVTNEEVRADISNRRFVRAELSNAQDDDVFQRIREWRRDGLRIGFTNGCFDILHAGHLSVLEYAAAQCDRLVVGLNSDASVKRLKGEARPVNPENDRKSLLMGLKPVDAVLLFEQDTPLELIERIQPDLLVKGGDYDADTVVGGDIVRARGGEVLIAPLLDGRSTTNIIQRSKN